MKKVLVTGAKGMLGKDLCPILEDSGYEVVETDIDTMDITDIFSVNSSIEKHKPDVVIHCAAYTNVDGAEADKDTAEKINSAGTENIAKICAKNDAELVYISTDYVFDGKKSEAYLPYDEPNPLNEYGLTKLKGEQAVQKYCEKYYIVRTSWLYGIHGKNFVETMISLAQTKKELNVVDDQIGCPTWTVELANAILKILDAGEYGIYHACGSGSTSWCGFAKKIFELENIDVNIQPCATEEFPRPARRPKYSVMDNGKLCRKWETALKDYLMLRV